MNETLAKAIANYGESVQIIVAVEEMSELQKALCKMLRHKKTGEYTYGELYMSVIEEIADVEIMLEQLKMIFHSEELVGGVKVQKLKRLEERIK